jgi:carbonic anhydrase
MYGTSSCAGTTGAVASRRRGDGSPWGWWTTGSVTWLGDERRIIDRLCELNALEQALNVCRTSVVQDAWRRGQRVNVHGWIYGLEDGLLQDLGFSVTGPDEMDAAFQAAITRS